MKRRSAPADEQLFLKYMPQILLLAAVFIFGGIIGSLFAANLAGVSSAKLNTYAQGFASASFGSIFLGVFWTNCLLLLAIFLSAFFRAGVLITPAVFAVKGFNLSLLITALIKVYGMSGYLVSLSVEALYAFGVVACMMLPAVRAVVLAGNMGRKTGVTAFEAVMVRDNSFLLATVASMLIIIALSVLYALAAPLFAGATFSMITK